MNPDDYAIVVGIDAYPALRPLRSSVEDATRFARWLESPTGGGIPTATPARPFPQVQLITSPPEFAGDTFDAVPVQNNIDRALRDFGAAARARIGRRLYFYFAGHGFGLKFDDVGLLMARASMDMLNENIGLRPYLVYFHEMALFDEVIFILDCCRDPVDGVETRGPVFTKGQDATGPKPPPRQVESFVVLAAEYGAKAFAPTDQVTGERRGLLTKALLEGLEGVVAADAKGRITASSLHAYLLRRVPELAKGIEPADPRLVQNPRITPPQSRDLLFRTLTEAEVPRAKIQVVAPPGLAGDLVVRLGDEEVARRPAGEITAVAAPWVLDLIVNTKYAVEHTVSQLEVTLDPRRGNVFRFPIPA